MRSLAVLSRVVYLSVSYVWDCGPLARDDDAGLRRFAGKLRAALLELGGVYVKLGQLLSTRPDLVDPIITKELEVLLDECPAEPLPASIATIREELALDEDDDLPFEILGEIASASFGCVYRVRLGSGQISALKVMRRGIEHQARGDLRFMTRIARALDILAVTHRYRMVEWIEELQQWTGEELDYQLEARKMTHIANKLVRVGGVKVPRVNWPLTTRRLLTMEFLEGRWLSKGLGALSHAELSHAASLLFQAFLYQIFEVGFFHADLHKGNLCLLPDDRIGMVDFGITGFVTRRARLRHLGLVAALQRGDLDEAFAAVLDISFIPPDADLASFKRQFEHEYHHWFLRSVQPDSPAAERGAGALMLAIFRRAYECAIVVDAEVVRYYRAFSIVDGSVNSLDHSFSHSDEINRYLQARLRRQLEDLSETPFDPIGNAVALSTEFTFRAGEMRRVLYGASRSLDSAVARVLLIVAGIKRSLSRVAWVVALFALLLGVLVHLDVVSSHAVLVRSHRLGKIEVGDVTAIILPMLVIAILLGWFGRLLRARAYSSSQSESASAHRARGRR